MIPIVEPFRLPAIGIRLRDVRTMGEDAWVTASGYYADIIEHGTLTERPGAHLCEVPGSPEHKWERDLQQYVKRHPRAPGRRIQRNVPRPDNDCTPHPRRSILNFAVLDDNGDWVGAWMVYNIIKERDDEVGLTCSGMALPGIGAYGGFTVRRVWRSILRTILEQDFRIMNSPRVIDMVEWRFPQDDRHHRWVKRAGENHVAVRVLDDISADHDLERHEVDGEQVPKKLRRRPPRQAGPRAPRT